MSKTFDFSKKRSKKEDVNRRDFGSFKKIIVASKIDCNGDCNANIF